MDFSASVLNLSFQPTTSNPYQAMKEREMTLARETYPELRSRYQEDLRGCLKLAAAANVIDFFREPGSIKEDIRRTVNFALDDSERLEAKPKTCW